MKIVKITLLSLFFGVLTVSMDCQNIPASESHTAASLIAEILKKTGASEIPNTVDVIKEGDPQTIITGIVSCMFATMGVLHEAVEKNCNLIIVHEPLYYNHLDETAQFQNDPVFIEKQSYIREHKLVIFRFHDYIHSMVPDGIEEGMINKLGWRKYLVSEQPKEFTIPSTDLKGLLKYLKQIFPVNSFNVIGNPDMKVTNVGLCVGAPGSQNHIQLLEDPKTDVVIAGEAQQWETYEYMRDAVDQGRQKAIIFIGHISSEEAGMDYCASWLKSFIKEIPVYFISSGSSYWSY